MSNSKKDKPSEDNGSNSSPDQEEALLRQVITLGTLIKILVAVGGLLVALGVYEVNQLDKLRDQANSLQANVSALQVKVDATQTKLDDIKTRVDKSGDSLSEISNRVFELKTLLELKTKAEGEKR